MTNDQRRLLILQSPFSFVRIFVKYIKRYVLFIVAFCVRDWSGILCENESEVEGEQRYSGKPDGVAGTPKKIVN